MAYSRTTLKRRMTYGRGTRRYRQTVYRRAYFNRRRGRSRERKEGSWRDLHPDTVLSSTNTNGGIYLLNGIQEGVGSWNRSGRYVEQIHWTGPNSPVHLQLRGATPPSPENGCECWYGIAATTVRSTFDTIFGQTSQAGSRISVRDGSPPIRSSASRF